VRAGRAAVPIAASDSLRIAVADETAGTLWIFGRDGRLWAARADLRGPSALFFAPDGTLLVAEAGAGRVRRFGLTARPNSSAARGD
jgi:sugar lactone lactonase YvrE